MINGISRQNNVQARPAFGARQVTGLSSEIQEVEQKLIAAKKEGAIKDFHILQRADSYGKKFRTGIATYILGVDDQATILKNYDVIQGYGMDKYKEKLKRWCGNIIDLAKPAQKTEDLLKEMEAPDFDYSKI